MHKQMMPEEKNKQAASTAVAETTAKASDAVTSLESYAGEIHSAAHTPELHYLNEQHGFGFSEATSGFLGGLKARIRHWLFGSYIRHDIEFRAHLVRHLNEVSSRMERALVRLEDRRDGGIYALENRMGKLLDELRQSTNARDGAMQASGENLGSRIKTLESVVSGLERIVAQSRPASTPPAATETAPIDYRYLLLENRFRGSEEEISSRLKEYPSLFQGARGEILEMGSGRGELQRLFREAKISSYGCELDEAMVERCLALSLDVRKVDGLAHLRSLPESALGGFVAIQVVEHLPVPVLEELLALLRAKVSSGGKILLETINSESLLALARNYFRDPTHVAPLHPDTLRFLVESAGLRVLEIRYQSAFPDGAKLQTLDEAAVLGPRARETVEVINRNIKQLNDILFGFQDYALIAEVP